MNIPIENHVQKRQEELLADKNYRFLWKNIDGSCVWKFTGLSSDTIATVYPDGHVDYKTDVHPIDTRCKDGSCSHVNCAIYREEDERIFKDLKKTDKEKVNV